VAVLIRQELVAVEAGDRSPNRYENRPAGASRRVLSGLLSVWRS
jgi:hypothetical protein